MASNNFVSFYGRLTKDPELRSFEANGQTQQVANFSIAVNKPTKKEHPEALYLDCKCFGKRAETIEAYFHKGSRILLNGRLDCRRWEDKEGNSRRSFEVIVDDFSFVDSRAESGVSAKAEQPPETPDAIPEAEAADSDETPW